MVFKKVKTVNSYTLEVYNSDVLNQETSRSYKQS